MDAISISAASGMRSRMESLDLLANNIANSSAAGFKLDREFYNLYASPEASNTAEGSPAVLPVIERHWTDFSQGNLTTTSSPLDLALDGKGFFAINGPDGTLFTRNGNFRLNKSGAIVTQDGLTLQKKGGGSFVADSSKTLSVDSRGVVSQDGEVLGEVATLDVVQPTSLEKQSGTYFRLTDKNAAVRAASAQVEQGRLESANGAPAEDAVRLVSVMRQFEMMQKALSIGNEMNRRSVEEVARVS